MLEQLRKLWLPLTIAGAVAVVLAHMGAPDTTEEAAIFIAVGAFGLLALLVQRMDARQDALITQQIEHQRREAEAWTSLIEITRGVAAHQERAAEVLESGMSQIGNHMATTNAELRTLSERTVAALGVLQGNLLKAALRPTAKKSRKRR